MKKIVYGVIGCMTLSVATISVCSTTKKYFTNNSGKKIKITFWGGGQQKDQKSWGKDTLRLSVGETDHEVVAYPVRMIKIERNEGGKNIVKYYKNNGHGIVLGRNNRIIFHDGTFKMLDSQAWYAGNAHYFACTNGSYAKKSASAGVQFEILTHDRFLANTAKKLTEKLYDGFSRNEWYLLDSHCQ